MPSYYDSVGEEPTYGLAESIIKATIQGIKKYSKLSSTYSSSSCYAEDSLKDLGYRYVPSLSRIKRNDTTIAIDFIIKHFPDVLKSSNNALYVKDSAIHLLGANDLLIMEYYLFLLKQYEERVAKYQRYLKKQQIKQDYKLLFILILPFILSICMFLVGD